MGSKRKRNGQEAGAAPLAVKKKQKTAAQSAVSTVPAPLDSSPFVNNPRGDELKREVSLYDILSSENEEERLNAAAAIISGLLEGEGVDESTLQRHLERRLFRGLASGRKAARIGYALVVAEILAQLFGTKDLANNKYTGLTFDKVLEFLVAKTKPDGDLSGQEEKDHSLGLLFGLQSFVRAKILFADHERWNAVLEKLIKLSEKKPWIREECGWVIAEALGQMGQSQAEQTLKILVDAGLALSPEGVGIWLLARSQFPDMAFPSKPWGQSGNPLEHLKALGKALKESSSGESIQKTQQVKQTGNWNPKLHFVWNLVLAHYATALKNKAEGIKLEFENFWKVAVDENLFSASASRERKYWGFILFQRVIEQSSDFAEVLPSIFSHNLVRCMINHVQDEDRFLNRSADKSLKAVIKAVGVDSSLLPVVLPSLISGYGTYNFDRVTKTKTVEQLLRAVDDSSAIKVLKVLIEPTVVIKGDEIDIAKEGDVRRQILADHLLNMIRTSFNLAHESRGASPAWIAEIALPAIATYAYNNESQCQPPVSEKIRELYRNRLMSIFGHLLSDLEGYKFPCNLLLSISPDAVVMDEGITEARDGAMSTMKKLVKKIKKEEGQDKLPLQALALLYSLVIFQLYNGEGEAVSIIDELKLCYDKLIRHKDTDDSDADASEILVELLLSFISKPSALLRKASQHVFGAFMSEITAGGLKLMTDVLESDESLRGQRELFDQEPENFDEMEQDGEEDELDSDVEVIDMNGDEGHLNGHLDDDEESDEVDEDEVDDDDDEDDEAKKLDDALAKALGTHRLDQDADAQSDSDADMTDSEMMALDSKLVEIFSQRKKEPNKKQEQKDAKETMINFKTRILDLLALYIKKQASNPLAFGLILPLLQLIRTTKTKSLADKSHNLIHTFAKTLKSTKKEDSSVIKASTQLKLLKAIHREAAMDQSHAFAKAASTSSLMIASSLVRADKGTMKKIAKVYHETQDAWMEGELEKMQMVFFSEFLNWCQSHAKNAHS